MNWPDFHRNGWQIELHGALHGARIGTAAAVKVELSLKDIKIDYVPVTAKNRFSMLQTGPLPVSGDRVLGEGHWRRL